MNKSLFLFLLVLLSLFFVLGILLFIEGNINTNFEQEYSSSEITYGKTLHKRLGATTGGNVKSSVTVYPSRIYHLNKEMQQSLNKS